MRQQERPTHSNSSKPCWPISEPDSACGSDRHLAEHLPHHSTIALRVQSCTTKKWHQHQWSYAFCCWLLLFSWRAHNHQYCDRSAYTQSSKYGWKVADCIDRSRANFTANSPLQPMNVLHLGPYDPTDRAWAAWSRGRKQTRDTLLMTCVPIPSSLVLSQFSVLPNVTAHATSV